MTNLVSATIVVLIIFIYFHIYEFLAIYFYHYALLFSDYDTLPI